MICVRQSKPPPLTCPLFGPPYFAGVAVVEKGVLGMGAGDVASLVNFGCSIACGARKDTLKFTGN